MKKTILWFQRNLHWVALVVFFGFVLTPYFLKGYYNDDSTNSSIHGIIGLQNWGLWGETIATIQYWTLIQGRIYPLAAVISNSASYYELSSIEQATRNFLTVYPQVEQIGGEK